MFRKLINLFKTKKVPRDTKRIFDIGDWHPLKKRYESFRSIIEEALYKRDNQIDDMDELDTQSNDFVLKYERWMIENIKENFNCDVDIEKLISLDMYCSGHIDYVHKFSFRLAELEEELMKGNHES